MSKKHTLASFSLKANLVHSNKYDYSEVCYKSNKDAITIICKTHGKFSQRPDDHLNGKGCNRCGIESRSENNKLTTEIFKKRSFDIHGLLYNYDKSEYTKYHEKLIITCKDHGDFLQTPAEHLSGCGCPLCANNTRYSNDEFIELSREIHGNKYNYSFVEYVNTNTKVKIECPKHGFFYQTPNSHTSIYKQGCPKCSTNRWTSFREMCKKRNITECYIYLANFYSNDENFYKIGIALDVKKRLTLIPYKCNIVAQCKTTIDNAIRLEMNYLDEYTKFKYEPKKIFAGKTECFDISYENVCEIVKNLA